MNSAANKNMASALAALLRAELRDIRFSVTHLVHGHIEFVPGEGGGHTSSRFDQTFRKELDARGLKALHQEGAWKREARRSDIRVKALCRSPESAARLNDFERFLDDIGILSEGRIAHALGLLLPGSHNVELHNDFPETSIGFSTTADLWNYLLIDACLTGPRRTAAKMLRWARGAPLAFETRVLLGRLNTASSFVLPRRLAVERLPRESDRLDAGFRARSGVTLSDYLDRAMLRIPCQIAPVLTKPIKITEQRDGTPVESWKSSADIKSTWPLPLGGISDLSRALSLMCNVEVETPLIWTDYGNHAHFGQQVGRHSSGTGEMPPRTATESTLTANDLKDAIRLQPALRNMPDSVETAFRYWLKSKSRRPDQADSMVFLRTALEALFLDGGNRAELTFRLATNGAWYTGRNPAERRQCYNTLKNVYTAASGAVHSGRIGNTAEKLLTDGQEICRLAILKRLRSKQDPVWESIVFGR